MARVPCFQYLGIPCTIDPLLHRLDVIKREVSMQGGFRFANIGVVRCQHRSCWLLILDLMVVSSGHLFQFGRIVAITPRESIPLSVPSHNLRDRILRLLDFGVRVIVLGTHGIEFVEHLLNFSHAPNVGIGLLVSKRHEQVDYSLSA